MSRISIYQLFVRHFSNTTEAQVYDGTKEENGCGTFDDISTKALLEIKHLGFTHIWLTGVLEHASQTSYPGRPADLEALVKGKAGSPYAVTDYYDICPDLAKDPENRIIAFQELLLRIKSVGLRSIIDFVPNHVARSYNSDMMPEESFGLKDDPSVFFNRDNAFFYLEGEGDLQLPNGNGIYAPETNKGRVTGNNSITWTPSNNDWYETVKLNYGFNFTFPLNPDQLPKSDASYDEVPETWRKMDDILHYWAHVGVDGVRCDMAHMVPNAFWDWVIKSVRKEHPEFLFIAEGYAQDPMSVMPAEGLSSLSAVGMNGYYDQDLYHQLKAVVERKQPVQTLDFVFFNPDAQKHGVRYVENHDEVRCANPRAFGNHHQNLAATAVAWLTGAGPIMLYNGQEVGEPAIGATGYSGDDGRTSIFDYTNLPVLQQWVNHGSFDGAGLSLAQQQLREAYGALTRIASNDAFIHAESYGLNYCNPHLNDLGVFCFMRYDETSCMCLVVANLQHCSASDLYITIPAHAFSLAEAHHSDYRYVNTTHNLSGLCQSHDNGDKSLQTPMPISYSIIELIPTP